MELVKGMFGTEFGRKQKNDFGLQTGQMRAINKMTHNSGWYNAQGERLGWGDLSITDMANIRSLLEPDQSFVVLSESDSFWNFVEKTGGYGWQAETNADIEAPGVQYIKDNMMYLINRDGIFGISNHDHGSQEIAGVPVIYLSRPEACKRL